MADPRRAIGEMVRSVRAFLEHELADRDAVLAALRAEMAGGEETGFEPADEGGTIVVSFTSTVVHGARS